MWNNNWSGWMKQSLKMLSKFLTAMDTEEKSIIFIINIMNILKVFERWKAVFLCFHLSVGLVNSRQSWETGA